MANGYPALLAAAEHAVDVGVDWLQRADGRWSERRFKASGQEVTDADVEVERLVADSLRDRAPDIPVVGEESTSSGPLPSRCWLLDPIDGTVNFARGAPVHAVSLALVVDREPVLGVVHAPALGRRWSGYADADAVSAPASPREPESPDLTEAVIGLSGTGSGRFTQAAGFVAALHDRAYRLRMYGATSLDLVGVAEGWLDACVCVRPHPWDVAAGAVLVRRAGLELLGAGGHLVIGESAVLVAGHQVLARELLGVWQAHAADPGEGSG